MVILYRFSPTLSFPFKKLSRLPPSTSSSLGLPTLFLWNSSHCHDLHVICTSRGVLVFTVVHFSEAFNTNATCYFWEHQPCLACRTPHCQTSNFFGCSLVSGHPSVSGKPLNVKFHENLYILSLGDLIYTQGFNYQPNTENSLICTFSLSLCSWPYYVTSHDCSNASSTPHLLNRFRTPNLQA